MPTSDQCALGPDGKLLDASEIVWVNDPDDLMPVASIQQAVVDATALPPKSSGTHPFFRGPPPAVMVAGSRRSGRVSRPSKRALDPDNIERPNVSKRPRPSHQKNVVDSELDSDEHDQDCIDNDNDADGGIETEVDSDHDSEVVNTDLDSEAVEEAYASTKAMGDADREVSLYFCKFPLHDLLRLFI
jgi:hypothetical protein